MRQASKHLLVIAVLLLLGAAPLVAARSAARTSVSGGSATRTASTSSVNRSGSVNSANVNRNTSVNSANVNRNTNVSTANVNRNTNVNVNRNTNVNVNVESGYGYGHNGCCYHPVAAATAVAVTAAVIGSMVHTLPPACTVVNVNGVTYQQCGSTWYQPQFSGTSTTYVVVAAPR